MAKEEHQHITLTPLTPLALILTLGGAYEEFAPARQTASASTKVFPNPTPIPKQGRVTQVVSTDQTTLNAGALAGAAGGFLASTINYTNSAAPLTAQPTVDQQTWDTLQSVAISLVRNMNCWQPAPRPNGAPGARDVVGKPRDLPPYNPPAGLSAYSSGGPSAPFCSKPAASESINEILPVTPKPTP
jgi:hypothetical protein